MPSFLGLPFFTGVLVTVSAVHIPESNHPCTLHELLVVEYPMDVDGSSAKPHQCGKERDLQEVKEAPKISIEKPVLDHELTVGENPFDDLDEHDENAAAFTLVMVDPDAPADDAKNPKYFLHWLIVDVPGADNTDGQGLEIKSYEAPNPPAGNGLHRYQFFAYKQPQMFPETIYGIPETRANFDLEHFQDSNGIGLPVAGYQFLTKKEGTKDKLKSSESTEGFSRFQH